MEELREKLYKSILAHGTKDKRTIKLSQKLDKYMVNEQKKYGGNR